MNFYGFDSFQGMNPKKGDEHPFYTTFDFSTDFNVIKKRFARMPEVKLIPGFFEETLKRSPQEYGIGKVAVAMIDCDLYSAAQETFRFLRPIIQKGTVLILDDYFNYLGDKQRGVRAAFVEFCLDGVECEELMRYGICGVVFLVSNVSQAESSK